jgi:hypothetical protein
MHCENTHRSKSITPPSSSRQYDLEWGDLPGSRSCLMFETRCRVLSVLHLSGPIVWFMKQTIDSMPRGARESPGGEELLDESSDGSSDPVGDWVDWSIEDELDDILCWFFGVGGFLTRSCVSSSVLSVSFSNSPAGWNSSWIPNCIATDSPAAAATQTLRFGTAMRLKTQQRFHVHR